MIDKIREAVRFWAASQPLVSEVWLFGSRAKGVSRPGSDVDLAIVISASGEGVRLAFWIENADRWKAELSRQLGLDVSVNHLDWSRSVGIVAEAVRKDGQRLYLRAGD
ncbi:nucleotidyltransferase domain-containing protein [Xanthobacter sp. SG618]|uniref:nucleotidyltransferase family protein n=1 Tax=Xanthobacter sp. SG618 TaxID=2587121 RepID=UPI001AEE7D06